MLNTFMSLLLGWCHIMYLGLCNTLFPDRSLNQWAVFVDNKIKFWRITMAHRGLDFYDRLRTGGDSPGFWLLVQTADTLIGTKVSAMLYCQDTVQTYSCSTMQFTEACHLELVMERTQRPRYSLVSQGPWLQTKNWSRDSLTNNHDHISQ